MRKRKLKWILLLVLALALVACGGDDDKDDKTEVTPTPESVGTPALDTGPGVGLNTGGENNSSGSQLPGCSDPNDDECPTPLMLDMDGEVSAGGVTVSYPTRYFVATTDETDETGATGATGTTDETGDILIEIAPSENNKFEQTATFQIYFADSIDAALADLTDPIAADWQTETFQEGRIGVVKDQTQEPPVNTTIGAFALADGRAIVLKVITTGKYGWDLYTRLYEDMLNSLVVSE